MLEAAGSMQLLTDELDRISLQPGEEKYGGALSPHPDDGSGYDTASLGHPSSSSKFDSAFGSQTDEESIHSQPLAAPKYDSYVYSYTQELEYHNLLETGNQQRSKPLRLSSTSEVTRSQSSAHQRRKKRSKRHHSSSQRQRHQTNPVLVDEPHRDFTSPLAGSSHLRREGSVQSISSTCSTHSSRILSIGLSRDDLRNMAEKPQSLALPPLQFREGYSSTGSGESTPKAEQKTLSLEPEIVVVDSLQNVTTFDGNEHSNNVQTVRVDEEDTDGNGWGTVFYQDSITPQPSPRHRKAHTPQLLPRRYRDTTTSATPSHHDQPVKQRPNAPKRSASILQRLKRKHGSFNRTDRQRKRRVPVKRSFSDRIAYHIRKGWVDYEEDLELISQPSRPRQVGRMIDTQAGRRHVVELHRPPSGKYGIFISEGYRKSGVFISRFADLTAAKFYVGLLSPGDEIVRVNGENVGDKSLDYVYDILTDLDAVVLTVIPIGSRPDW